MRHTSPRIFPFEKNVERYEAWFTRHHAVYQSELEAVRALLPDGEGVEIGVGSGRFAEPLGIRIGVEPSEAMRRLAAARGIDVVEGVAEALPFEDGQFDFALMVTTVCFLDDPGKAFAEANRVLRPGGSFIAGFVDRESPLGRAYERDKARNVFYRDAEFYSVDALVSLLTVAGFRAFEFRQTVFRMLGEIDRPEPVRPGYGQGSFVVLRGTRT